MNPLMSPSYRNFGEEWKKILIELKLRYMFFFLYIIVLKIYFEYKMNWNNVLKIIGGNFILHDKKSIQY